MSIQAGPPPANNPPPRSALTRFLDWIEWAGNKLPDPALLFVWALAITWVLSALLAPVEFAEEDPRSKVAAAQAAAKGEAKPVETIRVKNQLEAPAMSHFLERMVETFVRFPPLGVVLVAMLGVGVAEHTGFINALLKWALAITPRKLLTPMLLLVALISHTAGDSGYVLIIPLGGIIFAAAGRHPLAGIVCAFAGVSGGFSANLIVSPLDTLLQGLTQSSAQLLNPGYTVNPLCNYFFMASSSVLIIAVGWFLTDRVIEPKLQSATIDGDPNEIPVMGELTTQERRGMTAGLVSLLVCFALLAVWYAFDDHFARIAFSHAIVPLIFLLFLVPGTVHGYVSGSVKSHRDVIKGMSKSMSTMGYYLVMAFFAALFIFAFNESGIGILLAVKGANFIAGLGLPPQATIIAIIFMTTSVNLLLGSASAKWALLGPIFVPMLMHLGFSPEFTQAAYRVGDSSTNIITPLMPYFPLIVVYCQRYVTKTGIGTLISLMLPYSVCFIVIWTTWLIVFWQLGLPLGIPAETGYTYTP
jgi:aminobenzoyl-glutamate transport protein